MCASCLKGRAADLCNHLSCCDFYPDFEAKWALSSFANWRDLLWSDLCSMSNLMWNILLWGSFFLGLFFLDCAAVNWKWEQDSEEFGPHLQREEREKCPTLFSHFPGCSLVKHSRGDRWQGQAFLSSWSVQGINVHLSLPDRFHHPPGHFNSFCKLEPFHQEMLGGICSYAQAWHCPENWETWVQLLHLLNLPFLLFLVINWFFSS